MSKLADRISGYQAIADTKLLSRVPIIILINGRSFSKITSLLDKPYCSIFDETMQYTALKLCNEIEGAFFAYQYSDEIVIVSRNDQSAETDPWYKNNLQKICSITASIATLHFNKFLTANSLNIVGDPVFTSQIFVVPNIMEAINTIIYKQQYNFLTSIQFSCFYELLNKYDKNIIKEMLIGLNIDQKIDLLKQECNVDFNNYPLPFRRGTACYKVPTLINGDLKNKWVLNKELPIFTKNQSTLTNLFKNGIDIFRKENL